MSKHTPGPWKVIVYPHIGPHHPWIEAESNYTSSGTHMSVSGLVSMEDARLIAAAPDLLELVQSFVTDQVDYMTRNKLGDPEQQHNIKWARRLFAQIKGEA